MGMFDNFKIKGDLLPLIPIGLKPTNDGYFIFQTKDTDLQAMATYIQNEGEQLVLKRTHGEWIPGEECVDKNASIGDKLASLGTYVITDTWYEFQSLNGKISFYNSLYDPDSDGSKRYVNGWIEYIADYADGIPKSIIVYDHNPPYVLTDDEVKEREEEYDRIHTERLNKLIQRRKTNPTPIENLIDSIASYTERKTLHDESDLTSALNNIELLIKEYREKHDPYYRP